MFGTISSSLARNAQIRHDVAGSTGARALLSGLSLIQVLTLIGTGVLVLLGVLVGGRAFVAAVDPTNMVTHTAPIEVSAATADLREPASRGRES